MLILLLHVMLILLMLTLLHVMPIPHITHTDTTPAMLISHITHTTTMYHRPCATSWCPPPTRPPTTGAWAPGCFWNLVRDSTWSTCSYSWYNVEYRPHCTKAGSYDFGCSIYTSQFFFSCLCCMVVWWAYITDTIIPRCCPDLPRIVETLRDSTALLEGEEQPSKGMVYSSRLLHGAAVCREVDDVLTAMVSSVTTC